MSDDVSLTAYIAAAMLELDANVEARLAFPPSAALSWLLKRALADVLWLRDRSRWSRRAWAV